MPDTVPDPIHAAAEADPEAPALIDSEGTLTYAALNEAVGATAERLRRLEIEEGSRVAWYLPRERSTLVLFWALMRIGAVAVPISTRTPSEGVPPLLRRANATHCITEEAPVAAEAEALGVPALALDECIRHKGPTEATAADFPLDRPATIVFTSGSTGDAKAALHTWGNHYFSARGSAANIPVGAGDRWLLSLPLYHVGGLAIAVRCALGGAAVVLPTPGQPIAGACAAHRITHLSLVATQLRRVLRDRSASDVTEALKAVLVGGGPVPFELFRQAHERGWPVHATYGCTEMASQVATTPPGADLDALQTAGQVLPHREVTIAESGDIWVRGDTLFPGYVDRSSLHDPSNNDGWYPTGDLGRIDEAGYLHVEGRIDNQFISGGENIQPEEIERALRQLDGVRRAVVVPVPDDTFGQRPVAFVDVEGSPEALEDWRAALSESLPRFKLPIALYAWPGEHPGEGMKVDREALRQRARRMQSGAVSDANASD